MTAGWLLSIFSGIGAVGGIAFGSVADGFGRLRTVVAGLACLGAASVAGAFAPTTAALLTLRALEGFGFVAAVVALPSLIADATAERERRLALGLWSAYVPVGSAIVLFAAPAALVTGNWRALWLVTGVLSLGAAATAALALRSIASATSRPAVTLTRDIRVVAGARFALLLALGFAGYTAEYLALVGFLPAMLVAGGMTIRSASVVTAFVVLANGGGNITGGVLTRWFARSAIMIAGALGFGAGAVALYAPTLPLAVRLPAALVAAFAGGMVPAAVFAAVPLVTPARRLIGTTQGLVVQGSSAGQLFGPVLVAAAGGAAGAPFAGLVMACFALVAVACGVLLRARERSGNAALKGE